METTLIRNLLVIAFLVMGAAASIAQSEINTQPKPAPAAPGNIGVIDNTDQTGTVDRHKSPAKVTGSSTSSRHRSPLDQRNDGNIEKRRKQN